MEGKLFVLAFAFAGLGIFCGPIVQLGSAWRHAIPVGLPALGTFVLGLGVVIFMTAEGLDHFEAIYASVITGTLNHHVPRCETESAMSSWRDEGKHSRSPQFVPVMRTYFFMHRYNDWLR